MVDVLAREFGFECVDFVGPTGLLGAAVGEACALGCEGGCVEEAFGGGCWGARGAAGCAGGSGGGGWYLRVLAVGEMTGRR